MKQNPKSHRTLYHTNASGITFGFLLSMRNQNQIFKQMHSNESDVSTLANHKLSVCWMSSRTDYVDLFSCRIIDSDSKSRVKSVNVLGLIFNVNEASPAWERKLMCLLPMTSQMEILISHNTTHATDIYINGHNFLLMLMCKVLSKLRRSIWASTADADENDRTVSGGSMFTLCWDYSGNGELKE